MITTNSRHKLLVQHLHSVLPNISTQLILVGHMSYVVDANQMGEWKGFRKSVLQTRQLLLIDEGEVS